MQKNFDNLAQELNQRFAKPLKDYYKRRIIFWKDEERVFEDIVTTLELYNAKIVTLDSTNNFIIKQLLTVKDTQTNYLVYCPVIYPDNENWLLPIELYSEYFQADQVSIWLEEMIIENNESTRNLIKSYHKFFKKKEHRTKIAVLSKYITQDTQLEVAIIAVLCGLKNINQNEIIYTVLTAGLVQDNNVLYKKFEIYDTLGLFWKIVIKTINFCKGNLDKLACYLLINATAYTTSFENLKGFETYFSMRGRKYCYAVIAEWLQSQQNQTLYVIARQVEETLNLKSYFNNYSLDILKYIEIFPCVDECILTQLIDSILEDSICPETVLSILEKRRTYSWYDHFKNYYKGILHYTEIFLFYRHHSNDFHMVHAKEIWEKYIKDYYKMDMAYRHYHCCFYQSFTTGSYPLLDDKFKDITAKVERLYNNWFLEELGNNWSKACEDELAQYGQIQGISQQVHFYKDYVASEKNRLFVIISDALRYEVAVSLARQLRLETSAEVDLKNCAGIFPTKTKFGMAALLPHNELSLKTSNTSNSVSVLIDDSLTDASHREAILKKYNPNSIVLKYEDIIQKKRLERKELVKNKNVIYIYHDKIDNMSHSNEIQVFDACTDAIKEILKMVHIIINEFQSTNVIITADHGFLYTYSPLTEYKKLDKSSLTNKAIEVDRRYLITKKGTNFPYLMPVKLLRGKTPFDAFTPRGSVCIKKQGKASKYVHGGISLQEMVIPVIKYHFLKNNSKKKKKYMTLPVTINLLAVSQKISNTQFSLAFYQKEAVGDYYKATTYLLYFENSHHQPISNVQKIIADKANNNIQERIFQCDFTLKPMSFNPKEIYYLVINNEEQPIKRETFTIDIPDDAFD